MEESKSLFGKCPYFTAQKVFSGKWSILIMYHLSEGELAMENYKEELEILHRRH